MKTKLITALRTCAKALEQGTFEYDWSQPQSCNCGVVACAAMGESIAGMAALIQPMRTHVKDVSWRTLTATFCPVTGMPDNKVFKALMEAGMTQQDIVEL